MPNVIVKREKDVIERTVFVGDMFEADEDVVMFINTSDYGDYDDYEEEDTGALLSLTSGVVIKTNYRFDTKIKTIMDDIAKCYEVNNVRHICFDKSRIEIIDRE